MSEAPPPEPAKADRPLPLFAVCLANILFAISELASRQMPAPPAKSGIPPFAPWFRHFLDGHAALLVAGAIGLLLLKRWGFLLTTVAYFGLLIALVVQREPWVCAAATQFPLFAIMSLQWKYLR